MPTLKDLSPDMATRAQQLLDLARQEGIDLRVTSAFRTPEKQAELYAQGRTTPGGIITNATPGKSFHNHGMAIDVAPFENGKPAWGSKAWDRIGTLGKSVGLRWGGDFKSIKDRPHFELDTALPTTLPTATQKGPSLLARARTVLAPREASAAEPDARMLAERWFGAKAPAATTPATETPEEDAATLAARWFPPQASGAVPPSTPGATGAWASGATGTWETDAPAQPGAESPQRSDSGAGYLGMMPGFEFMGVLPQDTQESIARDAPGVIRDVAATGINVAGPAVGAAVGAASRIPGGAVMGEMAGSYGARKLNVALGLEEEGMIGDATSVVIPGAVRTAGALWKPTLRHLPGATAALHEEQGRVLQALPETIQPPVPSAQLYAEVAQQNPMIRPGSIWRGASDVISRDARRAPTLQGGKGVQFARDVHDIVRANGGQIPLQTLNDYRKDLGLLIRQAAKENWPEQRALRGMYKSFYDDLDHAAAKNVPGAQLLKEANKAARSEFAAEDLGEMFANGHAGIITRPDGLTQLHGGKLRDSFEKRLARDDLFRGSFTPSQVLGIRETFTAIEKLPRMSPPRGQAFGSGMAITRAGLAGLVTQAITGSPTAATIAGSVAASAPYYIGHLLMTDGGRAWLVRTLAAEGGLSPAALGLISGGARQLGQGDSVEHTPLPE